MTAISTKTRTGQKTDPPSVSSSLEVLAVSSTEWRVRNTALPESDGSSVLGVVQLIGNTYEVMQIGVPLCRYYFASLEDAVDYLGQHAGKEEGHPM